jgi:hypothetical protein
VTAILRDGTVSDPASFDLSFDNDVHNPPRPEGSYTPSSAPPATQSAPLIVGVTGDGAVGQTSATEVTDMIASWNPGLLTYLRDVYEDGMHPLPPPRTAIR